MKTVWLLLPLALSPVLCGQPPVDPGIAAEIARIKAIDNHAHPARVPVNGKADTEFDAMPVESLEEFSEPVRMRADNPEIVSAWRALYGYSYQDRTPGHARLHLEKKRQVMTEKGDAYPAWVLDKLGIETMLANRVAMGPSVTPPRFRWVSFADALLFPLNNAGRAAKNSDYKAFYADEDRLLVRYLTECGYTAPPRSFDEYLSTVVTATLERHKRGGAIAEKFEVAYLRSLDFAPAEKDSAASVYARYAKSVPPDAEYKTLQDFLFRYIASECGRLGMAVHLHTAAGADGYFHVGGANPLLLESVLNDPALRKTNFVMIHGGWPFTHEVTALLWKPNAYADFSEQTAFNYPGQVAAVIREWLEAVPEKVLFATDAYPFSEDMGWEEAGWLATNVGRRALGMALTGMLRDGEITRKRAIELAHMVLHDNAAKLYGLDR
ncbi:MAG: amidohydrolase family protein [Bryobacteraceae bacterium]